MLTLPAADSAVWLLVAALVVWRLTTFVVYENGPLDSGLRLRRMLVRLRLAPLVTCFHCAAVWLGLAVAGLLYGVSAQAGVVGIAVAGAASLAEHLIGQRPNEDSADE